MCFHIIIWCVKGYWKTGVSKRDLATRSGDEYVVSLVSNHTFSISSFNCTASHWYHIKKFEMKLKGETLQCKDDIPTFIPWNCFPCTDWIIQGTNAEKGNSHFSYITATANCPVIGINSLGERGQK